MAEEVIIKIELEKGQNEKEVDALTSKITNLTKANNDLKKSNNELIKSGQENSKEYIENTKQLEINKQKIAEATSSRKNLIQTILSEDDSIKGLRARNAELIKQRDQLSTATEEGRIKIAQINAELDKNNETIKENVSNLEKQKINVGNYKSALDGLVPGLGGFVDGIQGATRAALAFIATPLGAILGAIGLALAAVTAYFKGSEEGQNKFNKLVAVGSAILEQFVNLLEAVGGAIVEAFENPQAAIEDFIDFVKENLFNRFEGFLELIPKLGDALNLLFSGEFVAAGKVAADAVGKVVLGVENATDKIAAMIQGTADLINQGIQNGERLAELTAQIDRDERRLIEDRAKTALEVGKLRQKAIEEEGDARREALEEAIALEEELAARETAIAQKRLAFAELELKANGDDKEALKAVAEARAAVFQAQETAFNNTIKFRKQIEALDEEQRKRDEQAAADAAKASEEAVKRELDNQERIKVALIGKHELEIQQGAIGAATIEERVNKEIELEQFKTETLLANETLFEEERQLIVAQSEANILAIKKKGIDDETRLKEQSRKKQEQLDKIEEQREISGRQAVANAAIGFARAVFGENKAVAAAQVTLSTIQAIARAYADYAFPYSLVVSILMGALGAAQLARIAGVTLAKGGLLVAKKFGFGGVAQTGGVLNGPSHAMGGIKFSVGGRPGFEAEGGEAIINKRSTAMFRKELSAINAAGGGVKFAGGTILASGQTRSATQAAEGRSAARDAVLQFMENLPPIMVTVEDINARQQEVSEQTSKAMVI